MNSDTAIYVAGHRGLVGSALLRALQSRGYTNVITRTHAELELTDQAAVRRFFASERPEIVFLAAAKVGGIMANNTYRADFIYDNIAIATNIIRADARWSYCWEIPARSSGNSAGNPKSSLASW